MSKEKFVIKVALKNGTIMKGPDRYARDAAIVIIEKIFEEFTKDTPETEKGERYFRGMGTFFPVEQLSGIWFEKE